MLSRKTIIALIAVFCCGFIHNPVPAYGIMSEKKFTVVIDPGHGGSDFGSVGPNQLYEKMVTLQLSRMIADKLERNDNIKPVLTRTDDYSIPLFDRTAKANQLEAAVFISIHIGAGFDYNSGGISIYQYDVLSDSVSENENTGNKKPIIREWSFIQSDHLQKSNEMAQLLKSGLLKKKLLSDIISINGAQLQVLEGANMPALLIEFGNIHNPIHEDRFRNSEILSELSQQIASTILLFLLPSNQ